MKKAVPKAKRPSEMAMLVHDIRNPLSAIQSFTDVLLETTLGAGLEERQREIILRIRTTSERLIEIARNYNQLFSLKHRGKLLSSSPIELHKFIHEAVQVLEEHQDIKLQLLLSAKDPRILLPHSVLGLILTNLISNAVKYTPTGGLITISTKLSRGGVELSIRNAPAHIPFAEIKELSKPYYRGTNRGDAPGSGIGLYIVSELVKRYDLKIRVNSSHKAGTTFILRFPLCK